MPVELVGDASELRAADVVVELVPEGAGAGLGPARRPYAAAGLTGKPGDDLLVAPSDGPVRLLVGGVASSRATGGAPGGWCLSYLEGTPINVRSIRVGSTASRA